MKRGRGVLISFIVSFVVFLLLAADVLFFGFLQVLDDLVNSSVDLIRNGFLDGLSILLDFLLGTVVFIVIGVVLLVYLYNKRRRKDFWFTLFVLAGGSIIGYLLKILIGRGRPGSLIGAAGLSFPSLHTLMATILFLVLIYLFRDNIKDVVLREWFVAISIFLILLVGFSRIYLNIHWFSDVLAGFAFGVFWFSLGLLFVRCLRLR